MVVQREAAGEFVGVYLRRPSAAIYGIHYLLFKVKNVGVWAEGINIEGSA
jgi:hypothetical protein